MKTLKNQTGIALISEAIIIAVIISLFSVVVIKVKESHASRGDKIKKSRVNRADGVSGGVETTSRPCGRIVGTYADGTTFTRQHCP